MSLWNKHMPKARPRYADRTPASLITMAARIGVNTATLVERMMRERPHPEQGYRSAMGCHSACNIDPLSRGIGVQN